MESGGMGKEETEEGGSESVMSETEIELDFLIF